MRLIIDTPKHMSPHPPSHQLLHPHRTHRMVTNPTDMPPKHIRDPLTTVHTMLTYTTDNFPLLTLSQCSMYYLLSIKYLLISVYYFISFKDTSSLIRWKWWKRWHKTKLYHSWFHSIRPFTSIDVAHMYCYTFPDWMKINFKAIISIKYLNVQVYNKTSLINPKAADLHW